MAELSGETIEELLWEHGCDVEIKPDTEHLVYSFRTEIGDHIIEVSELFWEEDENGWYLDTDAITILKIDEGRVVDEDLSVPESEEELVDIILRLGGELEGS
jgi:hypothetical protein